MADFLDSILSFPEVDAASPASDADIGKLAELFGTSLPEDIVNLWRRSAGIKMPAIYAEILSPQTIYDLMTNPSYDHSWHKMLVQYGWLLLLDMNSSDYVVMAIREPLTPRLVWMPHDDGPGLLYRQLDGMLADLLRMLNNSNNQKDSTTDEFEEDEEAICDADSFFNSSNAGDYALSSKVQRTKEDHVAARKFLSTPHQHYEWNFAAQLLDETTLAEWEKLLDTDHFIRRDVRTRLEAIKTPAIEALLKKSESDFDAFILELSQAAKQAGLKVGAVQKDKGNGPIMKIGKSSMILEAFFHRRNIPNAIPRLIQWMQDQDAGKNPNDRENNYMTD